MISFICPILKNDTNEPIKDGNRLTDLENKLMVTKGEKWKGGINQESGDNIYTLLYVKQINNKDPLYSKGNYTQYFITDMGKESEKE